MAKTESSQKPFRILEMYLRLLDGEVLTRPEEAARYGIDIRSVQRDINALRLFLSGQTIEGFSQTVAYSRKAGGYILRGNKKDLTREEALALCKILLESRAFRGNGEHRGQDHPQRRTPPGHRARAAAREQ